MPSGGHNDKYTDELADLVCYAVATTPMGLDEICETYPQLPPSKTIYAWLLRNKEFDVRYTYAKLKQADTKLEYAYKILKDAEKKLIIDKDGVSRIDSAAITNAKNTVDLIKWEIARLARKKYGDIAEEPEQVKKSPWVMNLKRKKKES